MFRWREVNSKGPEAPERDADEYALPLWVSRGVPRVPHVPPVRRTATGRDRVSPSMYP